MKLHLPKSLATVILRLGISVVFLFYGVDKLVHPESWIGSISSRLFYYLPFSQETFISLYGVVEVVVGVMLVLGFSTRIFALLASLLLVSAFMTIGITSVTVRDIGVLAGALSLLLTGSDTLSIDSKFVAKNRKKTRDYIELE